MTGRHPGAAWLGGVEGGLGAAKAPACATFSSSIPLVVTEMAGQRMNVTLYSI
jgi:hypothetical protein